MPNSPASRCSRPQGMVVARIRARLEDQFSLRWRPAQKPARAPGSKVKAAKDLRISATFSSPLLWVPLHYSQTPASGKSFRPTDSRATLRGTAHRQNLTALYGGQTVKGKSPAS